MLPARRSRLPNVANVRMIAHAGLVLSRYLGVPASEKTHPGAREEVQRAAIAATGQAGHVYGAAFQRRASWLTAIDQQGRKELPSGTPRGPAVVEFTLRTPPHNRLVIGLGCESPLETGLTLHHAYGVPIIPGSALKGLAAHYCDKVFGEVDGTLRKFFKQIQKDAQGRSRITYGRHRTIFGATDDAGFITFHDAWLTPDSLTSGEGLVRDVTTPHHEDYYGQKRYSGGERQGQQIPPTDFDDPIPVQFLSVRGTFHFAMTCDDATDVGREWLAWTSDLLKAALRDCGIGGKTSSGYGRLVSAEAAPVQTPSNTTRMELASPPIPAFPKGGNVVEAELLAEKSKKGGRMAQIVGTLHKGSITNSAAVPEAMQPGDRLQLKVRSANAQQIQFDYLKPEELARLDQQTQKIVDQGSRRRDTHRRGR